FALRHGDELVAPFAIGVAHVQLDLRRGIAVDTEHEHAVIADAQAPPAIFDLHAARRMADDELALLQVRRQLQVLLRGKRGYRKQCRQNPDVKLHRSNSSRCPSVLSSSLPACHARWPLTNVAAMVERKR